MEINGSRNTRKKGEGEGAMLMRELKEMGFLCIDLSDIYRRNGQRTN